MSMISGSWKESEEEQERNYSSLLSGKYKDTSIEDYEFSLMRRSEDSTPEDRLRDYEGMRHFRD